ncbi:MaoC/PaaZ C-terminal domain-containing protein [Parafrankia discariae]|uniref:MaoC/PaaZ C-terminal domain-containing protein n=1 Tax=Parafrankia discariae TaxID=365528 RepID=UPI0007C7D7B9
MTLHPRLADMAWSSGSHQWNADSAALYALAVGSGPAELSFALGADAVLPTFPTTLVDLSAQPSFGPFDSSLLLHTRQSIALRSRIPVTGTVMSSSRVVGLYDAGPSAVVDVATTCCDGEGRILAELTSSLTIRREGGFGGPRPPVDRWSVPEREPDHVVEYRTGEGQALLYRLTGDRNPLHWDPGVARGLGLRAPLLHGLCTFGYAGRALLGTVCAGDVDRFGWMSVRFTAPVYPGDELSVRVWTEGEGAMFQVWTARGKSLDGGRFELR